MVQYGYACFFHSQKIGIRMKLNMMKSVQKKNLSILYKNVVMNVSISQVNLKVLILCG